MANRGPNADPTTRYMQLRATADGAQLRTATLHGTAYLVVPTVSKLGDSVEWPVNAPSPEFIPARVLAFATESRNNRPVTMDHPQRDGVYVSANDPDILSRYAYGHVFSARYDDGTVRCDLWLDPIRAAEVGPEAVRIIERLRDGETIEVSEGDLVVIHMEEGEHNGKLYKAVWDVCISDHIATLPEGSIGACSINDGCGALRSSSVRLVDARVSESFLGRLNTGGDKSSVDGPIPSNTPMLRAAALSQARTPSYSGTETSSWSAPSFSDYVRYLHEGKEGPSSVSQASSDLKRRIAAHSLLGDPDASTLRDLALFPVVNPANGKLNEKALRSVLGGRGAQADISESALNSARDVARRLLNKEFGVELEASMSDPGKGRFIDPSRIQSGGPSFSSRLAGFMRSIGDSLRSAMSNNELRMRLYNTLREMEPGVSYVLDEDVEKGIVLYCVVVNYGDTWDYNNREFRLFRRTFSIGDDRSVTINDDPVEVEWFEGYRPVESDDANPINPGAHSAEIILDASTDSVTLSSSTGQTCHCHKGESTMDRKSVINRLCALSAFKGQEKVLEAASDVALESLDKAYPAIAVHATETPAKPQEHKPAEAIAVSTTSTSDPNLVTISASEYEEIRTAAAELKAKKEARKTFLVSTLKVAQDGFTEVDLLAMPLDQLEKLGKSFKVEQPVESDYSLRGIPAPRDSSTERELPDTWGLRAAGYKM